MSKSDIDLFLPPHHEWPSRDVLASRGAEIPGVSPWSSQCLGGEEQGEGEGHDAIR